MTWFTGYVSGTTALVFKAFESISFQIMFCGGGSICLVIPYNPETVESTSNESFTEATETSLHANTLKLHLLFYTVELYSNILRSNSTLSTNSI